MAETLEIRWHGRGGQGTVTGAKVYAEACLSSGSYVQAFPEYGPERSGAPVRAFNRISSKEIRVHCPVLHPKVVIVADATLLDAIDVTEGVPDDGVFLVNTPKDPGEIRKKLKLKTTQRMFTVDATRISIDNIGRTMPNAAIVGALAKAVDMTSFDSIHESVRKSFGKKFSQKVIVGNLYALQTGYKEVKEG
ncbi:MAG: 2-oxoacid:acceptor oxidoreductase family protein [Nitrospirae bacterium]|nr:2-oxoacid:acceptor oxidoreductase family protein [Nitrospirota bacterium]